MGWLLGLPLGLFRMLAGAVMLLVRLAVPILIVAVLIWLWIRYRRGKTGGSGSRKDPHFKGPVYTVNYQVVEDEENEDSQEP